MRSPAEWCAIAAIARSVGPLAQFGKRRCDLRALSGMAAGAGDQPSPRRTAWSGGQRSAMGRRFQERLLPVELEPSSGPGWLGL